MKTVTWKRRAMILLGWTALAFIFAVQWYFSYLLDTHYYPFAGILLWELAGWYLWAALIPLISFLVKRYPFDRNRWFYSLPVHVVATVLVSIVHLIFHLLIASVLLGDPVFRGETDFRDFFRYQFLPRLPIRFLTYIIIVIVLHAVDFYRRYRAEEKKRTDVELLLTQAKLNALKMQLHPHFLFNTLNTISEMVHKNARDAEKMIVRLGEFLRLTLDSSRTQEVTLAEELKFLLCYLEIEQVRLQDRLKVEFYVEPQAMNLHVPNLILQPIVENAVKHGIGSKTDEGRIEIRARVRDGRLEVEIKDNGPGLAGAVLASKNGVGVSNVKARLEQLYGNQAKFELRNAPEGGLIVSLNLPIRPGEKTDENIRP